MTASGLADRTYATISGSVDSFYLESYLDENGNGVEDPGETAVAWYYWLIDPAHRWGVTVRSTRPPAEVLTYHGRGFVRSDPDYLKTDSPKLGPELTQAGITVVPGTIIDASSGAAGPVTAVALGSGLPPVGQPVEVSGSRTGAFIGVCTTDPDGNGRCDPSEQDRYEIVVFDPVHKQGVRVLVRDPPEFSEATMTGLLRREERAVDHATTIDGFEFVAARPEPLRSIHPP